MFDANVQARLEKFAAEIDRPSWEAFILEAIRTRYRPTLRYDVIGPDAGLIARAYNDEMEARGVDLRVRAEPGMKRMKRR